MSKKVLLILSISVSFCTSYSSVCKPRRFLQIWESINHWKIVDCSVISMQIPFFAEAQCFQKACQKVKGKRDCCGSWPRQHLGPMSGENYTTWHPGKDLLNSLIKGSLRKTSLHLKFFFYIFFTDESSMEQKKCGLHKKEPQTKKKGRKKSDRKEEPGKDQRAQRNLRDQKRRVL